MGESAPKGVHKGLSSNAFNEFMTRYGPAAGAEGPLLYVEEVLGVVPNPEKGEVGLDQWQKDTLRAFGAGERRISIRACHGPGKTAVAAWCITYNLLFRFPQKSVATAPSRDQLEGALVAEVHKWLGKLPQSLQDLLDIRSMSVALKSAPDLSSFRARTARAENPEALQGVHEADGWVFIVADEASAVHENIFESASGSMSDHNCQTMLLSNPTRTSGFFYDTHHKLKDMWFTIHIGAEDSSRVVDDFVEEIARRYGRESNAFRVRALGEFPLSDLDTIIPYEFVASARSRDIVVPQNLPTVWGLDVARFGDDSNALVKRNRIALLPDIKEWGGVNLMDTAGRVLREYKDTPEEQRPEEILVDAIGLGAGVVDRLVEQGVPAIEVNVSEAAALNDRYRNLRTELWFKAREWLMVQTHVIMGCEEGCHRECLHERLASELIGLRYDFASNGSYVAEQKREMKKRGLDSPNIAEAFILSFASEPAGLIHGRRDDFGSGGWNSNISRDRSMV